jgi:hypothetical protein
MFCPNLSPDSSIDVEHRIFFLCTYYIHEMGRACSMNGEKRNAYRILVGKPEGKITGKT